MGTEDLFLQTAFGQGLDRRIDSTLQEEMTVFLRGVLEVLLRALLIPICRKILTILFLGLSSLQEITINVKLQRRYRL